MKFFKYFAVLMLLAVALSGCGIAARGGGGSNPTPTPTVESTQTPVTVTKYVCPDGSVVADESDCKAPTVVSNPTEAPTAVSTATTVAGTDSGNATCSLEPLGPWSEIQGAGVQRIEVGGGGMQHADLYPDRGIKSVSFLVDPQDPFVFMGFGQIWQGDGPACASYDYVKDAEQYASSAGTNSRQDEGHSGLVVDMRGGKFDVLANEGNMSKDAIVSLLNKDREAMGPRVNGGTLNLAPITFASGVTFGSNDQTANAGTCTMNHTADLENVPGQKVTGPVVIELWGDGYDYKTSGPVVVLPQQTVSFPGGKGGVFAATGCSLQDMQSTLTGQGKKFTLVSDLPSTQAVTN